MSAPITIASVRAPSPASTSSSPSGLYVPLHKRSASASRSRSPQPRRAQTPVEEPQTPSSLVYTREQLLGYAHSPLATLSPETREDLRARVPEIVMNRRQRKALEFKAAQLAPAVRAVPRRRPAPRVQDRRWNTPKAIDEAAWRGRRLSTATPMPMPIAV